MNPNYKETIKKFLEGLGKNYINLIILALIGVLLLIGSSYFKGSNVQALNTSKTNEPVKETQESVSTKDFQAMLKNELKYVLSQIEGVGKVDVMIYCESGEEQVPAVNQNDSVNTTEEKAEGGTRTTTSKTDSSSVVMTNDGNGNEALILKRLNPKVTGVCVIAEGARKSEIKYLISKAVEQLFDIPANKVTVLPMKK